MPVVPTWAEAWLTAVRASLGVASNVDDIDRLAALLETVR
jgi:selenocysteine lyase/cysteine desulfurase